MAIRKSNLTGRDGEDGAPPPSVAEVSESGRFGLNGSPLQQKWREDALDGHLVRLRWWRWPNSGSVGAERQHGVVRRSWKIVVAWRRLWKLAEA